MPPKKALGNKRPSPPESDADGAVDRVRRPAKRVGLNGQDGSAQTASSSTTNHHFKTPSPEPETGADAWGSPTRKPSLNNTPVKKKTPPRPALPTSPAAELMKKCRAAKICVSCPSQLEYERSVASTNLLYRFTRPDCVVQPKCEEEVSNVVKWCRQHNLRLTVRGGSHSFAGFANTDQGVLLDMHRMHGTHLDMENKVMYV